jgi:uncharacterized protein DUF4403
VLDMRGSRGKIVVGILIAVIVLAGAAWAVRSLWPGVADRTPTLVEMPALAPVTRNSRIVMPAMIALSAVRDLMERAPRDLSGKLEIPMGPFAGGSGSGPEISWSFTRGTFALAGGSEGLFLSTALNGALRATGQFGPPGGVGGLPGGFPTLTPPPGFPPLPPGLVPPGGIFGGRNQAEPRGQTDRTAEQRVGVRGNVELTMRPTLLPAWRLQPNLRAQVAIEDASASIMGMNLNLSKETKPMVERAIAEQVDSFQARMGDNPFIEQMARQEWSKMCRSISLGALAPDMPNLWLEVRPTRAFAAQPGIDRSAITLTFGVQADTRIVPAETRPDCPLPAQLEIVPQMERGKVNLAVPVDIPFTEIGRLMEAQLRGKSFPLDRSGAFTATVQGVKVAASGGRLLTSLRVKANEHKSWFGLGAEATVHLWGRPALDRSQQTLRLENISLDVQSEAAFGVLGVAARAAAPYVEKALSENATIDLKPLAGTARKSIEAAIADFQKTSDGVRVDAVVTDLRLDAVEFDSKVLRVIAEADGDVRIVVTALPAQ